MNTVGYNVLHLDYEHVSTLCVLLTAWIGALLIVRLSIPFTPIRAALLVVVVGGTVLGATVLHGLFGIEPFTFGHWRDGPVPRAVRHLRRLACQAPREHGVEKRLTAFRSSCGI